MAGLAASAATVAVASGWWVAIVELIPASARPYIGGSTNNSVLDLVLGYDGFGRIFGQGIGDGASGAAGGFQTRSRERAARASLEGKADKPRAETPYRVP